ncbi:MAG TPA: hypothetical protein VNT92_07355 [Acidimicrobiia bacterium]|nr:hypothetical protein [Acidimicrobiia bacterium]
MGIRTRNILLNRRFILDWMIAEGKKVASNVDLADYPTWWSALPIT